MRKFSASLGMILMAVGGLALAEPAPVESSPGWALYGQATNVTQGHPPFRSAYEGDNSLLSHGRTEETTDVTLYAGLAMPHGAELWINPEIDQGFGLSNTLGLAGFASGEAYKVGANKPYVRLPRLFVRMAFDLGGEPQKIDAAPNQLPGVHAADNVVVTIGKFGVVDVFDTSAYAHDPRADFLNWSIIDSGAFDYAADAWGFTYGATAEWTHHDCTLRAGFFQLSPVPNGKIVAPELRKFMAVTELERRYQWGERGGKVKLLAFVNHAPMARYRDAVDLAGATNSVPDVALVRRVANRPGAAVIVYQELRADAAMFVRASANDGTKEAYEFTEINRSLAAGVSVKGKRWRREDDTVGVAGVVNALSRDARDYFSRGGLGILIGDGALGYATERILETYYAARIARQATLTLDYQRIANPAYNRDRGPVDAVAMRVHLEF
jgi:high affinity Mn2+ porin